MILTRGDTQIITFDIVDDNGNIYLLKPLDKIYFTVKVSAKDKDFVFQKTYGNGISYNEDLKCYEILIKPEDSSDLQRNSFVFDIEIIVASYPENIVQTLKYGTIGFSDEITRRENES